MKHKSSPNKNLNINSKGMNDHDEGKTMNKSKI